MIALNVNGREVRVDVDPTTPLLWVLRDNVDLTGTKYGCGIAQCGACTVYLDGQPVRACSLPVGDVGGGPARRQAGPDRRRAQCHEERAGLRLGAAPIPQAHPTAYPVYRLEWQTLGSLQRRLRNGMTGVRAEPFAYESDEFTALELFLKCRAAGMAHEGPGVRP